MKKTLTLLALFLSSALQADTVKIGLILPMTGNMSQFAQAIMPGIDLFRHELESGEYRHDYQIIIEDDQMAPRLTAQATQKLINIDKVDALMSASSGSGNVVAPMAARYKTVHIALASDTGIAKDRPYNFVHWEKPASSARAWVELAKQMGAKKVAIMALRQQGIEAILDELIPMLEKEDIELVAHQKITPGIRDFRMQLGRIKNKNPDVFMPLAFSPELEIILKQSREVGLDVPMPSIEVYDFTSEPALANGQYYVSGSLGTDAFKQRLMEATGKRSAYCLPFAYNILTAFREAAEQFENPTASDINEYLTTLQVEDSAIGPIATDKDGFIDSEPALFQIVDAQPKQITLEEVK